MAETKKRKASIREEDVLLLLNRYSPTTILNLLKEVSQFAGVKIDWTALMKRTATGISSAREYQMLWRHLAYRDPLLEKLEPDAEPLDDDSDLEFELEAFPAASGETSAEAAACVKVLISSGLLNETGTNRPAIEVALPTNTPNGMSCTASDKQLARSNRGANSAVPVSLQKQPPVSAPSVEVLVGNGSAGAGGPAKKKRKLWTEEEDLELIAAVDKCGEGNWANILKGDFKHDRTASQLSQRWSIIRKKRANLRAGSGCNPASSAPTEAHMATWQAVNMAIKMPIIGGRRPGSTGAPQPTDATNSAAPSAAASEATLSIQELPNQSYQPNNQTTSQKVGTLNPPNKSRANPKTPTVPAKALGGPASIIQAAAFAAGGRIATPSTAASHFKAAQSKNAVRIRPVGTLPSSSTSGSKSLSSVTTIGPQPLNIRCTKTPISPKDPVMAPIGSRSTSHQGTCSSSDQLSPSCNAAPSNQPTEQLQTRSLSASPVHADVLANGELSHNAIFDATGGWSEEGNKDAGEIKLDSTVSHGEVDLLNLDMDLEKAGVDQIDDSKAAAECQTTVTSEVALNKSNSPSVDTTGKAVSAVNVASDDSMVMTPGKPNGEMESQVAVDVSTEKGNAAENQIHNSEAVAVVAGNETLEGSTLWHRTPEDGGTIRD